MKLFKKEKISKGPIIGLILSFVPVCAFLIMSICHSYIPYWLYKGIDKNISLLLLLLVLVSIVSLVLCIKDINNKKGRLSNFVGITIDSITITFNILLLYLTNANNINFNNYSFIYKLSSIINKVSVSIIACLAILLLVIGSYGIFKRKKKAVSVTLYIIGMILACLTFIGINFLILFI